MKLATWNINSVRLRLPLVLQFLKDADYILELTKHDYTGLDIQQSSQREVVL